jgi:type III pantothenate kinase
MPYTILLDIGNTNIKIGVADASGVLSSFSLPGSRDYTGDSLGLTLLQLLRHAGYSPDTLEAALACSVVPSLDPALRQACKTYLRRDVLLVAQDLPIPLENRYAEPRQVGADRLVAAFAARSLFPEAASIICVDYGTATTFDCVEGNAYLGGLICPGVFSSAAALALHTAKLPLVNLDIEDTKLKPGTSTSTSMTHGFLFGFAAMSEGLCARLAEKLSPPCLVAATGGFAPSLARVCRCFDAVLPNLLLEGLRILHINLK